MKPIFRAVPVLTLLLFTLLSCGRQSDVTVIKLGHGLDVTHSVHLGMERMADLVYERSGGKMRIDIYPSQQLGSERETIELLQIGSLGMTKVSASVMEGFAPAFDVFNVPFLFRNDEHRFNIYEGEIGKSILMKGEPFWVRGLTYYDAGFRSFYTKDRPVNHPDDLRGLRIRVQESQSSIQLVNTMGGSATPISWGELYTALQQGVVDGAENNLPSFYLSRHYEVCDYLIMNEHTSVPDVLLISTFVWDSLTREEQELLQAAADESYHYQKTLWEKASNDALARVKEAGIEVIYPDKQPFVDGVQTLYANYRPDLKDLIQLIQAQ
ncbi:MAG: TRAP transporter substrate-binding protein [Balneolales bacterium]